ncbi:hypothetical protein BpHYR1_005192 [Brachionus plicatilis]|uniref:Uncharacterized protein n=1 Tax=Brachionus plicatilis TaxID=10195 RepID=A0A3M7SUL8_BRAPC|nr:hypothetical protein BpHYR1_005192 [Brachionus plicatilis]
MFYRFKKILRTKIGFIVIICRAFIQNSTILIISYCHYAIFCFQTFQGTYFLMLINKIINLIVFSKCQKENVDFNLKSYSYRFNYCRDQSRAVMPENNLFNRHSLQVVNRSSCYGH